MKRHVITVLILALMMAVGLGMGAAAFAAEGDNGAASGNDVSADVAAAANDNTAANDNAAANNNAAGDNAQNARKPAAQTGATGKGYKFRVTIYSGAQGTFDGAKIWKKDYYGGDSASISTEDLGFKLKDDKYYVRGFRVTGHDNDETTGIQRLQIDNIDTDVAYELAYGIKGALVSYVVNYEDENGKQLRASDTYYGMPGDKPVVSYRYVDGYTPNVYNMAKTLSENEAENVFTFVYAKGEPPTTTVIQAPDAADGTADGAAAGTNNGARAPGTAGNPAGTATAGQDGDDTTTIADGETPLAEGPQQFVDLDDEKTPLASGSFAKRNQAVLFGSMAAVAVGIVLILLALMNRRKKKNGEEPGGMAAA